MNVFIMGHCEDGKKIIYWLFFHLFRVQREHPWTTTRGVVYVHVYSVLECTHAMCTRTRVYTRIRLLSTRGRKCRTAIPQTRQVSVNTAVVIVF